LVPAYREQLRSDRDLVNSYQQGFRFVMGRKLGSLLRNIIELQIKTEPLIRLWRKLSRRKNNSYFSSE